MSMPTASTRELLPKNLKALRRRNRMTQEDIASVIGIQRSTYSRYEEGTNRPNYLILCKLADYYQVSLDELLGRNRTEQTVDSGVGSEIRKLQKLYNMAPEYARETVLMILEKCQNEELKEKF